MVRVSIVMTTIRPAETISSYATEIATSGVDGELIVVGDRKGDTPLRAFCAARRSEGLPIRYVGVAEQLALMARLGRLRPHLRWNSIQRRNLGYLVAAETRSDIVVSVDDDNIPVPGAYLRHHLIVGRTSTWPALRAPGGWFNTAGLLECDPPAVVRHRGFPLGRADQAAVTEVEVEEVHGRVAVNAGLWIGDPDIDAVTRLALRPDAVGVRPPHDEQPFTLHPSTWCPFNSQNTAIAGEAVPACFLWNMREPIGRHEVIDRYDDIFMSYFARRVIDQMGDLVAVGPPIVAQERNDHDLLVDLVGEIPGMRIADRVIDLLTGVEFSGLSYAECSRELTDRLQNAVVGLPNEDNDLQVYLLRSLAAVDGWLDAYDAITR